QLCVDASVAQTSSRPCINGSGPFSQTYSRAAHKKEVLDCITQVHNLYETIDRFYGQATSGENKSTSGVNKPSPFLQLVLLIEGLIEIYDTSETVVCGTARSLSSTARRLS
ncbi:hypothetical protein L914_12476, partial [Phytophthora nicotianae]